MRLVGFGGDDDVWGMYVRARGGEREGDIAKKVERSCENLNAERKIIFHWRKKWYTRYQHPLIEPQRKRQKQQ